LDRPALLSALGAAGARVVTIQKLRRQFNLTEDGVKLIGELGQVLSVKVAQVDTHESLDSVAIESEADLNERSSSDDVARAGRSVARARNRLPFGGALRHLNYLEALAVWAKGGRIGT
jgi:hypothetical protein